MILPYCAVRLHVEREDGYFQWTKLTGFSFDRISVLWSLWLRQRVCRLDGALAEGVFEIELVPLCVCVCVCTGRAYTPFRINAVEQDRKNHGTPALFIIYPPLPFGTQTGF